MPRKPRNHMEGTIYHVLNRGNNKDNIFIDKKDYHVFLKFLWEQKEKNNISILCYTLMPNHFHFLVKVSAIPLGKFMHGLQSNYAHYFNMRHNKVGSLFQDRYKAFHVEENQYLLQLIRYIHLNPMRAGLVEFLRDYPWTSHHDILQLKSNLIDLSVVVDLFETPERMLRTYQQLVDIKNDTLSSPPYTLPLPTLEHLLRTVSDHLNVSPKSILSDSRIKNAVSGRQLFCQLAYEEFHYTRNELSGFLDISLSGISRYLDTKNKSNDKTKELASIVKRMLNS
ncbi:hypothetical protein BR63_07915 [Thermanaerosceptrum fracticalcis]|uniref:Transposase IS200-like domain-containing protein n=1 Tax=Thermanaerosceptrum fracticalcis TaxID=1712410 RepID=A0A7G6E2E1_THEFR|nr:transposase [Thermanaerosceptrum fracticalcis]QNB46245.1 hypothetical protein BR63_07915 [Thermanaerosceptrum fracticalcis]